MPKETLSWLVMVEYVEGNKGPESGWEATVDKGEGDGWEAVGYEAGDPAVLLARVAADARSEVEHGS